AEDKSNKEITNLIKINPTTARRLSENGKAEIVDVADLKVGDKLSVLNGDQIPTDGVVISGSSSVDQSSITGESIPVRSEERRVGKECRWQWWRAGVKTRERV